jgi:hypothetical protein
VRKSLINKARTVDKNPWFLEYRLFHSFPPPRTLGNSHFIKRGFGFKRGVIHIANNTNNK